MFSLLNFTVYPYKMFHTHSLNNSHPTNCSMCSWYICKRPFRSCGETLAKRNLHPSHPRQDTVHYSAVFSCSLPLKFCSSLLLLLGSFWYNSPGDGTSHCYPEYSMSTFFYLDICLRFGFDFFKVSWKITSLKLKVFIIDDDIPKKIG